MFSRVTSFGNQNFEGLKKRFRNFTASEYSNIFSMIVL
nr:MAG TPA: hypothetical protein [Caudoviricetes sp.]